MHSYVHTICEQEINIHEEIETSIPPLLFLILRRLVLESGSWCHTELPYIEKTDLIIG